MAGWGIGGWHDPDSHDAVCPVVGRRPNLAWARPKSTQIRTTSGKFGRRSGQTSANSGRSHAWPNSNLGRNSSVLAVPFMCWDPPSIESTGPRHSEIRLIAPCHWDEVSPKSMSSGMEGSPWRCHSPHPTTHVPTPPSYASHLTPSAAQPWRPLSSMTRWMMSEDPDAT